MRTVNGAKEIFEEIKAQNSPKLTEDIKLHTKSSENPQKVKTKLHLRTS